MSPLMLNDRDQVDPPGRVFTCGGCGQPRITPTFVGPFPRVCDVCIGPDGVADRERTRGLARRNKRRNASRIAELEARVTELQDLLGGPDGGRASRYGEPGRAALARAIRQLTRREGGARGREGFADALLTVSDIARAWAVRVSTPATDPDPELARPAP